MRQSRALGLVLVLVVTFWKQPVRGQASLDSWPPWSWRPERAEVSALQWRGRALEGALFLFGEPGSGGKTGTAFCICPEHHLLVTAAHLLDPERLRVSPVAVMATTGWTYPVLRWWVHPGFAPGHSGSDGAQTGLEAGPLSADVALVQLGDGGHPLSIAFPLAPPGAGAVLQRHAVGCVGYPRYVQLSPLRRGDVPPPPAVSTGVVCQTQALVGEWAEEHPDGIIWHTALSWPGGSGGPIFLSDGRAVAVQNASGVVMEGSRAYVTFSGVTVDAVWDLLRSSEGLEGCALVPTGEPVATSSAPRRGPDGAKGVHPDAVAQLATALELQRERKWKEACDLLNAVVEREPTWAHAYRCRAGVLFDYSLTLPGVVPARAQHRRYAQWVEDDLRRALEYAPYDPRLHNEYGIQLARPTGGTERAAALQALYDVASHYLRHSPEAGRREFYDWRAHMLISLGRYQEAIADLNAALVLDPGGYWLWLKRSECYEALGVPERARADRAQARRLSEAAQQ